MHIDVTYLPQFDGIKYYLFVAIDRATRTLYFEVYDAKTSNNSELFMNNSLEFFPFGIPHVLTDNGLEFTNRLIKSKKGNLHRKPYKLDVVCENDKIDHRLIKPASTKTNGMVERVNGTIKKGTILKEKYLNNNEMTSALNIYLIHYMLYKRHGGVRKELNALQNSVRKIPFNAIEKWYKLKPEYFNQNPSDFKLNNIILWSIIIIQGFVNNLVKLDNFQ